MTTKDFKVGDEVGFKLNSYVTTTYIRARIDKIFDQDKVLISYCDNDTIVVRVESLSQNNIIKN